MGGGEGDGGGYRYRRKGEGGKTTQVTISKSENEAICELSRTYKLTRQSTIDNRQSTTDN